MKSDELKGKRLAVFGANNVVDEGAARIVGDKHLKARVQYPDRPVRPIDVIAFNQKDKLEMIKDNKTFDVLYHVEENVWNNVVNIQLNVKDIRPSNSNE